MNIEDLKVTFKIVNQLYSFTTCMFIGDVKIASFWYDGTTSKSDVKKYRVNSDFFNFKVEFTKYETEEECKTFCLKIKDMFIKKLTAK